MCSPKSITGRCHRNHHSPASPISRSPYSLPTAYAFIGAPTGENLMANAFDVPTAASYQPQRMPRGPAAWSDAALALPKAAAERLRQLEQRSEDARALLPPFETRHGT